MFIAKGVLLQKNYTRYGKRNNWYHVEELAEKARNEFTAGMVWKNDRSMIWVNGKSGQKGD